MINVSLDNRPECVPCEGVCVDILSCKDSQVPEILVGVQVFVVDRGVMALVGDVAVRRYKCVSEGSFVNWEREVYKGTFQQDKAT